jgi:nucleoside-diphosphate-sugar epimerase
MIPKILIIGACGQIGSELTLKLREKYGNEQIIASDIRKGDESLMSSGPFEILDATDALALEDMVMRYKINHIYLMAAMLSATAEKLPMKGWHLNMNTLFNVLELGKTKTIKQIFWPSSIAVFGPSTPKHQTPQHTTMEPTTVYGISKQAGERWCAYYHMRYGVDVRSLRYPGLISYKTQPGGGTTDYAIEMFYEALKHKTYTCYIQRDTALPMMYMDDAIYATMQIMSAPSSDIKIRSSYNLSAVSFTPRELAKLIQSYMPDFKIDYNPDFRQTIAESWPSSIDDSSSRNDWRWENKYNLNQIAKKMIDGIVPKIDLEIRD